MSTPQFEAHFAQYLTQARQAHNEDLHHDHRRQLFLAFLHEAFGIEPSNIEVEKFIQIADTKVEGIARIRKGWIDAIFQDLIFEFKRDLQKEEEAGLRELRMYLSSFYRGTEYIGLLTDGLIFTAYMLDASQLRLPALKERGF